MTREPPEVRTIETSRSPPFVSIEWREEHAGDHRTVATVLGLGVFATVAIFQSVPMAGIAMVSALVGYATAMWANFDDIYGD